MRGVVSSVVYSVLGVFGVGLVACGASQAPATPPPPPPPSAPPVSVVEASAQDDEEEVDMSAWKVAADEWKERQRAREASGEVHREPGSPPPPPPPPPPAPPLNVPPRALDELRIAGEKNIVPDDVTKVAIYEAGKDRVIGSYKLCIKRSGAVASVTQLKATGFRSYDEKIMSTIRTQWRYRPFLINNKPARVCTAVTFIYSQYVAPPAPMAPEPPPVR